MAAAGCFFATERADTLRASGSAAVTVNVPDSRHVQLDMRILDARDSVVFSGHAKHRADGGLSVAELPFEIERPHLWQGTADPYLYTVTVVLADGRVPIRYRSARGCALFRWMPPADSF